MIEYGLIGKSLGHSFSKQFFEDYFKKNELSSTYSNIELTSIEEIKNVFEQEPKGLNVTIPYKEAVIPYLDYITSEANEIGAVNCISCFNGKFIGHNTDAYGFQQSIKPFLTNKHERAIIFGTGGASKAIKFVLTSLGIDVITVTRNPQKEKEFGYDEVNNHMLNACKLLVNCTPVGTFPNVDESIVIPFEYLTPDHLVVDLIYNPSKTLFLKQAEENGATILNGESMLREQALKSWEIWNAKLPND